MNAIFSRWLPCATLAIWSTILLYFHLRGRLDFLHPAFRPYVLVAGIVMALMALTFVVFRADADCCSAAECGHGLSRLAWGKVLTFLVLLVPVSAAAIFSPEGFSKNAITNRRVLTDASELRPPGAKQLAPLTPADLPLPGSGNAPAPQAAVAPAPAPALADFLQRTAEGYIVAEVLDLLYAAQDTGLRKDFEGKTVQLIGQLMPDATQNAKGNRFKAVRMFMTCCAADARPIATLVESANAPALPEMSWVKITGTATFPIENGRRISILKADRVEKSDPPEESMLY